MFKSPHKSLRKITGSSAIRDRYINYLARSIVCLGVIAVGNSIGLTPLIAAPTPATTFNSTTNTYEPTTIENQATGSFTDGEDPAAVAELIISNVVKVTVAEVAGITVGVGTAAEAPASVTNPGIFQGDGTINPGDIAYFDYVITNAGNDPTQFFIPGAPASTTGGTFNATNNPIQIIGYNLTGSNPIDLTATPVLVPAAGQRTGPTTATGADGLLKKNGIIPPGGTVTIRVPIKVDTTAAVGSIISTRIGNTPNPLGTNQVYISSTTNQDLYTQDNVDATENLAGVVVETAGIPVNGDTTNHRQESSNIGSTPVIGEPIHIKGKVFEDVNYGGGAGRDLPTSSGIVRSNVRVEIYANDGTYLGATLTDVNGQYKFNQFNATTAFTASKSYQIRVVNSFVTSSRTGGCDSTTATLTTPPTSCTQSPVQTFRTSGDNDANNIADADPNRVGGELPAKIDAAANTTSQNLSALTTTSNAAASLTTVALGTLAVSGVDFGYNFDTIVNTSDSGQGSLRQFINNSNALNNIGLAQVGKPAEKEVSIFMISDGTAHPGLAAGMTNLINGTGGNSGAAVITALTSLPTITDASTWLDASTQKTNVGNNASGTIGTGGTVGVNQLPLSTIPKPSVMLNINATNAQLLNVNGSDYLLKGFGAYGAYFDIPSYGGGDLPSEILIRPGGSAGTITQLLVGTLADGSNPGITTGPGGRIRGVGLSVEAPNNIITNNYFAYASDGALILRAADGIAGTNGDGPTVTNNEFANSDYTNPLSKAGDTIQLHAKNAILRGNLIRDQLTANPSRGFTNKGIEIWFNADSNLIENNTIHHMQGAGIGVYQGSDNNMIRRNVINNNGLGGIVIAWANVNNVSSYSLNPVKNTISQNSIFDNTGLGIDLDPNKLAVGTTGDGVSPNDGTAPSTLANYGMDYPIMTTAIVSANAGVSTLTVKGYVGKTLTGNTAFGNATLEFFVAAADTNDKGRVFDTDPTSVSKLHAEGQTYLGSCEADANGLFGTVPPCAFTVPTGTNPLKITATATDTLGNTSEFSAPVASDPNVLLVKRITAINGLPRRFDGTPLSGYDAVPNDPSPYDDNNNTLPNAEAPTQKTTSYWPNNATGFILGGGDGGNVKPNDSIEYTIYFLSTGEAEAKNVLFCDRVPTNVTFMPIAFNSLPAGANSLSTADRGIAIGIGNTIKSYSNVADGDIAQYFPPGTDPTTTYPNVNCGGANTNGAVVVNLGNIPNATGMGVPPESYGFVRFQGRVK